MYEEVSSLDELTSVVESSLEEYNNTHKTRMNLVIFRYNTTTQYAIQCSVGLLTLFVMVI